MRIFMSFHTVKFTEVIRRIKDTHLAVKNSQYHHQIISKRATRITIPLPAELCMELFTLLRILGCSMSIFDSPDDLCEFHSVKCHESSHNLLLQRLWKRVSPHMVP